VLAGHTGAATTSCTQVVLVWLLSCSGAEQPADLTLCPSLMLSLFVSSTTGRPSSRLLPGSLCYV
jgi:hypothetical protein